MQHRSPTIVVSLSLCFIFLLHTNAGAARDRANMPLDLASDALPGFFNLGVPYSPSPRLSLAGTAHYGVLESIGEVPGNHHEFGGTFAIGGAPVNWFSAALLLDGKYQKHPNIEGQDSDVSLLGAPTLKLRAGSPIGRHLLLGGELDIRVPGGDAPSLHFKATTLTTRILATVISLAPFHIGFTAGFCLNNSQNSAPGKNTLRPGDRIALDVSEFHSVLLGLAMSYQINSLRFILEADTQFYLSSEASVDESPTRITAGARYASSPALQFDLYTETVVGKRPGISTGDPFLPIPPRFAVFMGIRYAFGASETPEPAPDQTTAWDKTPKTDVELTPVGALTGTVAGQILDQEKIPISDATVSVNAADGSTLTATTDAEGNYTINEVPIGNATGTISASYFEPATFDVTVAPNTISKTQPQQLVQIKVGSQLRGLVRDVTGEPLNARILVLPGKNKIHTDAKGFFAMDVDPGEYTVEISAPGFVKQKRTVKVGDNSVVILNIDLREKK